MSSKHIKNQIESALLDAKSVDLRWYVAYTHPKREQISALNLEQQKFEAYLPLYKTCKKQSAGLLSTLEPMFPRYVFFRPSGLAKSG